MKKLFLMAFVVLFSFSSTSFAFYGEKGVDQSASGVVYEGATEDAYETTVSITDPTADRTVTVPDASGNIQLWANANTQDVNLIFEGATADGNETTVTVTDPSADRTITIPDASGTTPVMQASFIAAKMWVATDAIASGQTSQAVTVTGLTTAGDCVAQLNEVATNSVAIRAVVPTTDTATVHVNADPGASNADIIVVCFEA